ncbi:MAG: hypothetical protein IAA72_07470 [Spirochaetes bacterium]|uniref:Repressor LexA n=1 Tax=Candidatus Ornithospirochaeta stercoravium TaxID=2840897 RepID=A0A9D9NDB4_9SPIO|nr:hypothetical protein [Candidatus Ornithospirochaeta stercoravium]
MKDITDRQKQILDFISLYIYTNGRSPSLREIGEAFGFSHIAARDAVATLVRKGYLEKIDNGLRSLTFPLNERLKRENNAVPFYQAEPSYAVLSAGTEERIFIPRTKKAAFTFKVTSESMRNGGILPGDFAVMADADIAKADGDIVLASLGDDEMIPELRRLRRIGNGYALLIPDNDTMGVIKAAESSLRILGRLISIRRDYH